jgi:hypothetical protein
MTHASVHGLVNGKKVMHCGHILRSCLAKHLKKKVRLGCRYMFRRKIVNASFTSIFCDVSQWKTGGVEELLKNLRTA